MLLAFSFYSIIVKIAVHSFVYDMNSFLNSTKPNLQSQCMNMKLAVYLHLGLLLLSLIILLFWKIDRFPLLYCILFEMNRLSPQLLNICMLLHRHNRNWKSNVQIYRLKSHEWICKNYNNAIVNMMNNLN